MMSYQQIKVLKNLNNILCPSISLITTVFLLCISGISGDQQGTMKYSQKYFLKDK